MSEAIPAGGRAGSGVRDGAPLREALEGWRQWVHLEAVRKRPYGRHDPTLARLAQEHREQCEAAARELLCGERERAEPVSMRRLEGLLVEVATCVGALRFHLASGEVVTDEPLCGLLATQLAACSMLLWLVVGRGDAAELP
jgi:hypothetical protein